MKYLRRLTVVLLLACTLLALRVSAYDIRDVQPPETATKIVYGYSGAGRELVAYRFGNGKNVLVAGFAIHGYEDNWTRDGGALVYTANELMKQLHNNRNLVYDYDWTIYVLPCMNPDGLLDGYTCDGPGRCTTSYIDASGTLRTGRGIDLNRAFPHNWTAYSSSRNFNGSKPLAAPEAQALAKFVREVKGSGANLCLDVHGWFQQTIVSTGTESSLYRIFHSRFPRNTYASCVNSRGYFTSYTTALGYTSCLFEFPSDVYSMTRFLASGYCKSFNDCVLDLVRAYGKNSGHSASCPSRSFADVVPWKWYHNAVDYAVSHQIFNGVSATQFAPEQKMTRAMLVTTLYRIHAAAHPKAFSLLDSVEESSSPAEEPPEPPEPDDPDPSELPDPPEPEGLIDVPEGAWYADAVLWATEAGIVTGFPDHTFRPDQYVSREQLAAILHRYTTWSGLDVSEGKSIASFPDALSVSEYAVEPLSWAYGMGLIQGISDGGTNSILSPHGSATRAQTATILMRYQQSLSVG